VSKPLPDLPNDNLFRTPSPLVAAWLVYSKRVQYIHYETIQRNYIFFEQTAGICQQLIHDYNAVDPTVSLRRFHRTYQQLLTEKLKADGRLQMAKKELRQVANG
jgi:hypothetical protein